MRREEQIRTVNAETGEVGEVSFVTLVNVCDCCPGEVEAIAVIEETNTVVCAKCLKVFKTEAETLDLKVTVNYL